MAIVKQPGEPYSVEVRFSHQGLTREVFVIVELAQARALLQRNVIPHTVPSAASWTPATVTAQGQMPDTPGLVDVKASVLSGDMTELASRTLPGAYEIPFRLSPPKMTLTSPDTAPTGRPSQGARFYFDYGAGDQELQHLRSLPLWAGQSLVLDPFPFPYITGSLAVYVWDGVEPFRRVQIARMTATAGRVYTFDGRTLTDQDGITPGVRLGPFPMVLRLTGIPEAAAVELFLIYTWSGGWPSPGSGMIQSIGTVDASYTQVAPLDYENSFRQLHGLENAVRVGQLAGRWPIMSQLGAIVHPLSGGDYGFLSQLISHLLPDEAHPHKVYTWDLPSGLVVLVPKQ